VLNTNLFSSVTLKISATFCCSVSEYCYHIFRDFYVACTSLSRFFGCSGRSTTVMGPFCITSSKSLKETLRATVQYSYLEWLLLNF